MIEKKTEFQKLIDDCCERMIDSIMSGSVRSGVVGICHAVNNWAREQADKKVKPASNGFEAIHHGSHIVQFDPNVFVWYDEAAAPRGVETTLLGAQTALERYITAINKPKSEPPEDILAALLPPLEELPPPGSNVWLRHTLVSGEPGDEGRASIWFGSLQLSRSLRPENARAFCDRMEWVIR